MELVDSTNLSSAAMKELRREVEELYAHASVMVLWFSRCPAELPEHTARVYLLHRLPAILETRLRAFRGKRAMAAVFGERGTGQVIYVSRSAVSANASRGVVLSDDSLGIALGRVVSHELDHRFISPELHRGGVLKEALLPSDPTRAGEGPRFTAEQIRPLRSVAQPVLSPGSARE